MKVANLTQKLLSGDATASERLTLALLLIEPMHEEQRAARVLESLLEEPEYDGAARIWLAYLSLHFFMDESAMARGVSLLSTLLSADDLDRRAAACLLLGQIGAERSDSLEILEQHFRASIIARPGWVMNHVMLSQVLSQRGTIAAAEGELAEALKHVLDVDPSWDIQRREFERCVTGRSAHGMRNRIKESARELSNR